MKVVSFFKLIRWKNLLMLIIIQLLLKYVLFKNYNIATTLSNIDFISLVLSIVSIAAGGYIINDIIDIKSDTINKPNKVFIGNVFSLKESFIYYILLSVSGVLIGIYISYKIQFPILSIIFISIAFLLFLYSYAFKKIAIIGNLIISFIIGISVLILALFDILPNIQNGNTSNQLFVFNLILGYAFFSFIITLIRELIKDIEDIDGDFSESMKTLPILIGRERTRNITFIISIIFTCLLIYVLIENKDANTYILLYGIILVVLPLLYLIYKMYDAKTKTDYKKLSVLLKIIMVLGIFSILFI